MTERLPVPDGGRGARADRMRLNNRKRALEAHLIDRQDPFRPLQLLRPGHSDEEAIATQQMWERCRLREGRANLEAKEKRVGTGLTKYHMLLSVLPSLASFRPLRYEGDLDTSQHNEAILCILADFIRRRPKNAIGDLVKADTVSGQVSAIKVTVEEHLGRQLICQSGGLILRRVLQSMRREDGPSGDRSLSVPMGNNHLLALAQPNCPYDTGSDVWTITRWAMLHCLLQCLMRGGEAGTLPRQPFRPATGLCWAHFIWKDPATRRTATVVGTGGKRFFLLFVLLVPIKDQTGRAKRVPIPIRSKHPVEHGLRDITCPYTAIARAWHQRVDHVQKKDRATTPFFTRPNGAPVDTDLVREVIREAASSLGLDPGVFGSSALRRGGGTDLRDQFGSDRAMALVKQRGRWCNTDMPDIYARASAAEQAEASAAITRASADTLEQRVPGWVQPTRF